MLTFLRLLLLIIFKKQVQKGLDEKEIFCQNLNMWHRIPFIVFIAVACLATDTLSGDIGLDEQLTAYSADTMSLHAGTDEIGPGADYDKFQEVSLSPLDCVLLKDLLSNVLIIFSSILIFQSTIITYRKKINPFHGIP